MVVMNLGVVALPVIELRKFVRDPAYTLLRHLKVLREEITTALVDEPAAMPADPEVADDEVLQLCYCKIRQ